MDESETTITLHLRLEIEEYD